MKVGQDDLLASLGALRDAATVGRQTGPEKPEASSGRSFADEVGAVLRDANTELQGAEHAARELAAGRGGIVETMLAMGRADTSLRFVVTLRNRAMEAYQEIMRLQV